MISTQNSKNAQNKPKLLGTWDTDGEVIHRNHIFSIYPTCQDQVRDRIRTKHVSIRSEEAHVD